MAVEPLGLVDQAQVEQAMVEQTKVLAGDQPLEIMQELEVLVL